MHPRMTNMHAEAHDAFSHSFASAGALAFVNEYSESAAPPALYYQQQRDKGKAHQAAVRALAFTWIRLL